MAAADPFAERLPAKIRLPHPFLTTYHVEAASKSVEGRPTYSFRNTPEPGQEPPQTLHNDQLSFSKLPPVDADNVREDDNTPWALARRSPVWAASWDQSQGAAPTVGQVWLFLYTFFAYDHETESLRLRLEGAGANDLARSLVLSGVAIDHPRRANDSEPFDYREDEVLIPRSLFWQGCASPLGSQPIWLPTWSSANVVPHVEYTHTGTGGSYLLRHPRRAPKPTPGALIYSRYVPHLDEHFSLQAVDYENATHLDLFHKWQNDPRVAAGWMESGTLEHHRGYLRAQHEDPHTISVFGCFNDVPFAYFELYWAKEDKMGQHYASLDFDRGRHALVGDDTYRGRHRVAAWWPSIMHYEFIDDHRTENVVGEPRLTNEKILMYEYQFGHHQDKWLDLPHKRANLVVCSRERFFQVCPFNKQLPRIAGTNFGFEPKL
ncbi:acyl-CoA N-acyltransferase [Thelonectria olida]|uniref:Acyl-CoA N-acyltransferase n=1 Tax=Thelonectria olida TaxID=1576542 RepID=A0A9P8WDY1_9HYPO|nr:acyl-CoA N-acyltransferase [Thelonectria olida]